MTRPLIILRPEPGASKTKATAEAEGWRVFVAPLFRISALSWTPPRPEAFDALMITSANTIHYGGDKLRDYHKLPLYAVGAASAEAASDIGMNVAHAGAGDADDVARALRNDGLSQPLHLTGVQTRPFDESGLSITRIAVYKAAISEPTNLSETLKNPCIVLFHSPKAAARFERWRAENNIDLSHHKAVAISPNTLARAGTGWAQAIAVDAPTDEAMLATAKSLG